MMRAFLALPIALSVVACGGDRPRPVALPAPSATTPASSSSAQQPPPAADPLGPKPEVATTAPFAPPAPQVLDVRGTKVWFIERHLLPIVAVRVVVPSGSASDPSAKGGLSHATAAMLLEGAGQYGGRDLARAIDSLGASIETGADADHSWVSLTVLPRNLDKALEILGDVVGRPRFEDREWQRVHKLWVNDLVQRASDPDATARVVFRAALFGSSHPYAHPWDGTAPSARAITLADVKAFYASEWRPDRATMVIVGDVDPHEVQSKVLNALAAWKQPAGAPPTPPSPAAPKGPWPRFVIVDRPDAPQSVIAAVQLGVAAQDSAWAPLGRVNTAIGGSFTSRLNQDLREEKGYSYGARSRVAFTRGPGMIVSYASVVTDKTGDALKSMLADLDGFAKGGMNDEEIAKTRSQARSEIVSLYESVDATAARLGTDAALGLAADFEASTSLARDRATKEELNALAAKFYDPSRAILVVVGPRAKIAPQIEGLGLPPPELRDADGNKKP